VLVVPGGCMVDSNIPYLDTQWLAGRLLGEVL
jgi:hypothetical protein